MEDDFLMRQIKLAGEGIGQLFKKDISKQTLGDVQKEDGTVINRMDLIKEYLAVSKPAFQLINELKFKLSYYDFEQVSAWFIHLLKDQQATAPDLITTDQINQFRKKLAQLL